MTSTNVGRDIGRLEGRDKVTGRAEYVHHFRLPGMLYGKIIRSAYPHARIMQIRTHEAAAVPGVHQVVTIADIRKVIPNPYYGPAFHDQPILADGKVRFSGEPVAVVLAADPKVASDAAALVEIDYDELPFVDDEREAMTSQTLVHEELKPAGTFADLKHLKGRRGTNVALDYKLVRGDVAAAFAGADFTFEHTFHAQPVMHVPMEPFVSVADARDGRVTLYTSSQSPSFVRVEIARLLGLDENHVRVKVPFVGGGFGGKLYIKLEALVTALSMVSGYPVKIALSMEEEFLTVTRHACTIRLKSGVSKAGKILARSSEIIWNGGAYADIGPRVTQKAGFTSAGPYDIENVDVKSFAVYTNRPPAGALRGFGAPQTAWAYERHTDMIAKRMGIDPVAFRRQNMLRNGRPQASGTLIRDAAIEAAMDMVLEKLDWDKPFDRGAGPIKRGRGVAIGFKGITTPTTSVAMVNLSGDGSCSLYISTVDMGQGSDTVMAQIAGEVLGLDALSIRVIHPDTDVTPYDMGTLGSRSTFHMGNAVRTAAEDAKSKIAALAEEIGLPPEHNLPVRELLLKRYGMQAGNIIGVGTFVPDYQKPDPLTGQSEKATPFWGVGAAGAIVEVDTETGHVNILKLVNVVDVGTAINPKLVEAQISGSAIMQLGFTMTEKMLFRDGQLTNGSLADYKIPGLLDLPKEMISAYVSSRDHRGPFGAKGAGESASIALSPAIGNAVADAIGAELFETPLTPEHVYMAIQESQGVSAAKNSHD